MAWPTCPSCEKEIDPDSRVCASCGHVVTSEHMLGVISTIDNAAHELSTARSRASEESTLVGKRLGKYVLVDILGRGGMGTVYRAKHDELGHFAAIKILDRTLVTKQDVISRLFREARAAAQIGHVNIVQVHDFGRDPEIGGYIVMELIQGDSLERLLTVEHRLDESRVIAMASEIAAALSAAHAKGIIHRDLKPANVFLQKTATGELVKVMDFGIAKLAESRGEGTGTQPGTILGTPRYMSPEQWGSEPVDARSDVYSLGIMLYRMATGALPHPKATSMTQLARAVVLPIKPLPREVRPELSKGLADVIERCCQVAKEDRFASMDEVQAALGALRAGAKTARPKKNGLVVGIGLAAVAAVFAAVFAVGRSARPDAKPSPAAAAEPPSPVATSIAPASTVAMVAPASSAAPSFAPAAIDAPDAAASKPTASAAKPAAPPAAPPKKPAPSASGTGDLLFQE